MWRDREQDPRHAQQLLPRLVVPDRTDLQGHQPVVPAIERLDDAPLAADPEQLEDLVSLFDQRRHRRALTRRRVVLVTLSVWARRSR